MTTESFDYVIIGGGIAGASIGYFLAPHARVLMLERESEPGYHSTGRSAAAFVESYGPPQVRALTRASGPFLKSPPKGFADNPILTQRATMLVASPGQEADMQALYEELREASDSVSLISAQQVCERVPVLKPEHVIGAVLDPSSSDIDVDCLHQGYLKGFRRAGGQLQCNADVTRAQYDGKQWIIHAAGDVVAATTMINAAGAWGDQLAGKAGVAPIGLQPKRRSAFVFRQPDEIDCSDWPLSVGVAEDWYLKPEAGLLLGSPANADNCEPQDVQPEELDIAMGIDRIQSMTNLVIRRPERTWAGLRTFSPDGSLVGGFDERVAGFFWLVGQGGYGIQTSAAMGEACAALVRDQPIPSHLVQCGVNAEILRPARLAISS